MAGREHGLPAHEFACACLNVVLASPHAPTPSPDGQWLTLNLDLADGSHEPITVRHPELTLRERAPPVAATVQHVGLLCLVCSTLVYRVETTIIPGEPLLDGPIVPSPEWVERSALLPSSGIVEVARDCLTGEALRDARNSDQLSPTLHILCPRDPSSSTRLPLSPRSPQLLPQQFQPSTRYTLPPLPMPTLFAPPPFSPSHPVFAHLARVAQVKSEQLWRDEHVRLQAEIDARTAELDARDRELKAEVEAVWRLYRQGYHNALARADQDSELHNAASSDDDSLNIRPVLIRNPSSTNNVDNNNNNSNRDNGMSALSMSLLQRQLKVPAVRPPIHEVREPSPEPATDESSDPAHPRTPKQRHNIIEDAASLPLLRRNLDWNADVSASLRVGGPLSAQKASKQKKARPPPTPAASMPAPKSQFGASATGTSAPLISPKRSSVIKTNGATHNKDRSKQKVTFNKQTEVKVIDATPLATPGAELAVLPEVGDNHIEEEPIFELDGLDEEHPTPTPAPSRTASVPHARALNGRSSRTTNLLASMSYMPPSTIDRAASAAAAPRPLASSTISASAPAPSAMEQFKPHEQQLRELVGADLPSHRAGWRKNGKAWAMFARGRAVKDSGLVLTDDEAENDADADADAADYDDSGSDDDEEAQTARAMKFGAGSVPIDIAPIANLGSLGRQRTVGPQTTLGSVARLAPVDEALDSGEPATARERAHLIAHGTLGP